MSQDHPTDHDAAERLARAKAIEAAIQEAVREALLEHKRAGNPVAVWRNNQVIWIPPEEIEQNEHETGE